MLSKELILRVENKVLETYLKAQDIFKKSFELPRLDFETLRTGTAGQAFPHKNLIKFNPILLSENVDSFIERTVPHEVAHLLTKLLYPLAKQHHGPEWRYVMQMLGIQGDNLTRCHDYDVTNTRKNKKSYEYVCDCSTFKLSLTRHRRIQHNTRYFCKNKHAIRFTGIIIDKN